MAVDMSDSGLFTELGDLLGYDPTFYEEPYGSSSTEDIIKHFCTPSSPMISYQATVVPEPVPSPVNSDADEMDSLLSEGNMLLDQLMAENGLSLVTKPVELADINELISGESKFTTPFDATNSLSELFTQVCEPVSDAYPQTPDSSISSSPSELRESAELSTLSCNYDLMGDNSDELGELLSSLLAEDNTTDVNPAVDYSEFLCSPASSFISDYSSYSVNDSELSNDMYDDNSSTLSSPAPSKLTPRKKRSTPYSKLPAKRKEKKKLQNKEAAIRYRQKKKSESQLLDDEEAQLQKRNDTLKAEVLNFEREIMCMKELLSDVFNIHSI